jgi:serine/threonine protein kinase
MQPEEYENWPSVYLKQCSRDAVNSSITIIPCAPYGDEEVKGIESKYWYQNVPMTISILSVSFLSLFGLASIEGYYIGARFLHFTLPDFNANCNFLLLAMALGIWYSGRLRGISAILIYNTGNNIQFVRTANGLRLGQNTFSFRNITRVSLEPNERDPIKSVVRIDHKHSRKPFKFKLEILADRSRWQTFKAALEKRKIEVDPRIEQYLQPNAKDPSYSELWLEALGTAPGAELLGPLESKRKLKEGAYEIERQIGRGGQGAAYLARVTGSNALGETGKSLVVLKEYVLPAYVDFAAKRQAIDSFEQEARILGSIDYPFIVRLEDFFVEELRAYLVLEYVAGSSLKELVREKGPFSQDAVIELALCMVGILEYLHNTIKIAHQDFTPDNLIWSGDNQVKLIDFMVAKKLDGTANDGAASGKLAYMPPEQFRGEAGAHSDLYALGGTLYFLLTGQEAEPLTQCDLSQFPSVTNQALAQLVSSLTVQDREQRCCSLDLIRECLTRAKAEA